MAEICIVLPSHWDANRGGSEFRARLLAERLAADSRHRVTYLARSAPPQDARYPYQVRRFQGPGWFRSLRWGMTPDALALYRALAERQPDVVVSLVACAYTGVAAYYARRMGISMIWCLANDMDVSEPANVGVSSPFRHVDRVLFRYGVRHAEYVVAQTRHQADQLERVHGRVAHAVVPNFHPPMAGPVCKSGTATVLWVANLKQAKRPDLFVDLAASFAPRTDVRFRMIGRSDGSPWSRDIIDTVNALSNAEYLGELSMDEVNRMLETAHVLVNTSDYEGLPNTFIQAWMREVPVVSVNVDPDGVIAGHGLGRVTGGARGLEGLIDGVASVLDDPTRSRCMGAAARRFAETTYSMKNLERIVDLVNAAAKPA